MSERYFPREEIKEIRDNVNYHKLANALHLEIDEKRSKPFEIWAHSPFSGDRTASFHINLQSGAWYCFATQKGGGAIELVEAIFNMKINGACQWILDNSVSTILKNRPRSEKKKEPTPSPLFQITPSESQAPQHIQKTKKHPNMPTKFNLLPYLTQQGTHPQFSERGISTDTCHYLGCGHLSENSKSFLNNRIVFQVRSIRQDNTGKLHPTILTHIGRATTPHQETIHGKWNHYTGFTKTLELYNLDKALLDPQVQHQAKKTGKIIIVEGCFDLAKLIESGIKNCVATFGAHLDPNQIPRLHLLSEKLGITHFQLFYDRDQAGTTGQTKAQTLIQKSGYQATIFDWETPLPNKKHIPPTITDPCTLTTTQLQWLRKENRI